MVKNVYIQSNIAILLEGIMLSVVEYKYMSFCNPGVRNGITGYRKIGT